MKIVLTKSEATAIRKFYDSASNGCGHEALNAINSHPLIKCGKAASGDIAFSIDSEYVTDVVGQVTKLSGVVMPCLKAIVNAYEGMLHAVVNIAAKHTERATAKAKAEQAKINEYQKNAMNDKVNSDCIIRLLVANRVTKVSELPVVVQAAIGKAYPLEVIRNAEANLKEMNNANMFVA